MNMLAAIHAYLLPYRQIEGFLRVFAGHIDVFKRRTADYTTVWWRVTKVKVDIDPNVDIAKENLSDGARAIPLIYRISF